MNNTKQTKKSRTEAKNSVVVNKINVRPVNRQPLDIKKWRRALRFAESENRQRGLLYDIYHESMLDGHLKAVILKRLYAITNTPLSFEINNKPVKEVNNLIEKDYFEELLEEIIKSKFWGYTLCELDWPAKGEDKPGHTWSINRKHIKPAIGIVTKNHFDITGIHYKEHPYDKTTIWCGQTEDLGLLLEASQYVIYKRNNIGDFSEFNEMYGRPTIIGKYNNAETRDALNKAFEEMGYPAYITIPDGSDVDMKVPSNNGKDSFESFNDIMNRAISILILGQTMTTSEAKSSGYAQSKVHQEVEQSVHDNDREFVLKTLNQKLTPCLQRLGYRVNNGKWKYIDEDNLSLTERINIDLKVGGKVPIDDDYFYNTYKIPKPANYEELKEKQKEQKEAEQKNQEKTKKKLIDRLTDFFV